MSNALNRRTFVTRCSQLSALALLPSSAATHAGEETTSHSRGCKKGIGYGMIGGSLSVEDKFRLIKDLGFDGIEVPTSLLKRRTPEPRELAQASEKTGVPIHGVVNSSHTDLTAAIDEAALYGATSVLHVVRADNRGSYLANYGATQQIIRKAIAAAEKKRVYILIENVWATFLIEPMSMARYIDELQSSYVQSYFDIGNVLRWGWPQQWIEVLGARIKKVHVKEFDVRIAMNEGMRKAFAVPIGKGSIEWGLVCQELKKLDFHGWATAEVPGGDRQRLADVSQQMDDVLHLA